MRKLWWDIAEVCGGDERFLHGWPFVAAYTVAVVAYTIHSVNL